MEHFLTSSGGQAESPVDGDDELPNTERALRLHASHEWHCESDSMASSPLMNIDGTPMLDDYFDMHGNAYGFIPGDD